MEIGSGVGDWCGTTDDRRHLSPLLRLSEKGHELDEMRLWCCTSANTETAALTRCLELRSLFHQAYNGYSSLWCYPMLDVVMWTYYHILTLADTTHTVSSTVQQSQRSLTAPTDIVMSAHGYTHTPHLSSTAFSVLPLQ